MESAEDLSAKAKDFLVALRSYATGDTQGITTVIAVVSDLISRSEAYRITLLRKQGMTDRSSLSSQLGISHGEATGLANSIEKLTTLPALSDAVESGLISMGKARVVLEQVVVGRQTAAERDLNELIELATSHDAAQLRRAVGRWARRVDEEQAPGKAEETLRSRRSLETYSRSSGMTELIGSLDPESAEYITNAIERRVQQDWDAESAEEHLARTNTQRRVDALVSVCKEWMQGIGSVGSPVTQASKPTISVIITLDQLTAKNGHGITENGNILSSETVRRLACDCGIRRIIIDGASQVIDLGRTTRTFSGAVRKVITARDQHCRMNGCDAPPSRTEGHHIQHWSKSGKTDTSNGCLLCHRHHHLVHEGGWTLSGDANHLLIFTSPTGLVLESWPPDHPRTKQRRHDVHGASAA